jgi:spore coat protein JC
MWNYEKRLQYPVRIKKPDGMAAKIIITQFGGPDGELGASQRYLAQRYAMPYGDVAGLLTDIGTEAPEMFRSGANAFFDAFATV